MRQIHVHLLPQLAPTDNLQGATCVVIDVLRATTTIAWALAAGAESVTPCLEVEQTLELANNSSLRPLLGGERGGVRIEGFDFGNSPAEYSMQRVKGQCIAFTTTNGTKAMQYARHAKRVLLGAFVNRNALIDALREVDSIQILCAGTKDQITRDDVLLAGALVDGLRRSGTAALSDSARIAQAAWLEIGSRATAPVELNQFLAAELRDTQGGRNLIGLGLEADLIDAAAIDKFDFVPELELSSWRIRKA